MKILKSTAIFKHLINRFVVIPLTYCTTLLSNSIRKELFYKITLDYIVYFDKYYVTTWKCPIQHYRKWNTYRCTEWVRCIVKFAMTIFQNTPHTPKKSKTCFIMIFNKNVKLLYGSETWRETSLSMKWSLWEQVPTKHPWDKMARYHQQHIFLEKDQATTSGSNHQMELAMTHSKRNKYKHHKASLIMEPTRKTKVWRPKNTWRSVLTSDFKKIGKNLGRGKTYRKRQRRWKPL